MYPAEKLIAENKTTTPALMTQVMIVGLTGVVESASVARRLFFAALRSLGELDRRFALATAGLDGIIGECVSLPGGPIDGLVWGY
jgi:hypothetical protein